MDGWAYIYLGNVLWSTERFTEAENAFQKGIEVWPNQSVAHWSLAYYLERRGRSLEAKELYQRAIEIDPGDPQAYLRFGCYLKNTGERERAYYLHQALDLDPDEKRAAEALASLE